MPSEQNRFVRTGDYDALVKALREAEAFIASIVKLQTVAQRGEDAPYILADIRAALANLKD